MVLLSLANVSKAYVMNQVLKGVNLTLKVGERMGLVGVNGSGKSTLFGLITGAISPDEGVISLARGASIGLLSQHADIESDLSVTDELARVFDEVKRMEARLRDMEAEMARAHEDARAFERLSEAYAQLMARFEAAGGYEWPSRIQGVLAGLGFSEERRKQKSCLLSGGEKTRLCMARLLLTQPDLLLLDEPTNHLDLNSTQWLEDTLKKYKGTVMVISHDRYFLNAVCNAMAEISQTRLKQYAGNYDKFYRERALDAARRVKEYELQQAEIAREQAIIERYRMYNREKSIKAAESREKRLSKIERLEKPVDDAKVRFRFSARRRSGDDVLILKNLEKRFGERTLFSDLNLHLRAGDRVALIGPNGVGKTTLLSVITGRQRADAGAYVLGANVDIGYFDQQQSTLHPEKDVLGEIWDEFPYMQPGDVRKTLALFLITGEDVFRQVKTLSGGERARVALAKLMLKRDNLLLLDEPTNHLDMDSREVLENALEEFEGTLLTVSHDRFFINRVCTRVVDMTPEGVREYDGNYDFYLESKRAREQACAAGEYAGKTRTQLDKEKRRERLAKESAQALKARLAAAEADISRAEADIAGLDEALMRADTWLDHARALGLHAERERKQAELDELMDMWEALAEAAEAAHE